MAPIRRYLRISKYTVLECRIYLDNPSDSRWLLDGADPVLRRIFAAIRPLVPAKLREENERLFSRKKGKPVKDMIAEEDFEVSLFLRESRTRHSLLTRYKEFGETEDTPGVANTKETGIVVESDDEDVNIHDIPEAGAQEDVGGEDDGDGNATRGKRRRETNEPSDTPAGRRASKRQKDESPPAANEDKKMRFRTNYEGFNIFGWVLCLLVTRKGGRSGTTVAPSAPGHQPLMEEWISSQAQRDLDEE